MKLAQTAAISSGLAAMFPQLIGGGVQILVLLYGIANAGGHASTDAEFLHWLSKLWLVSILSYLGGTGAGMAAKSFFKFFQVQAQPTQTVSVTVPTASSVEVTPPKP